MTPEQISQLIELAQSVGLVAVGALGGVLSSLVIANKNLETVKLQIKNVNRNAATEKDVLFYREALLKINEFEVKLHEISEAAVIRFHYEKFGSKVLADIDSELDLLSKYDGKEQDGSVEKQRMDLVEKKSQFLDEKVQSAQEFKDAIKDLVLSLSEIMTGVYLTGNAIIITETESYTKIAHETYAVFMKQGATLDDMTSVKFGPIHKANTKLKISISKEFRKIIYQSVE